MNVVEVSPVPFPIGVNGITYDDEHQSVIVTNSQVPAIIEIADDGGEAGALSVIAAGEHLRGADGVALDKRGDNGLVFPSTLAFGQHGADKHAVFVANFGFGAGPSAPVSVLRIEVGEKSEKHPAGT